MRLPITCHYMSRSIIVAISSISRYSDFPRLPVITARIVHYSADDYTEHHNTGATPFQNICSLVVREEA